MDNPQDSLTIICNGSPRRITPGTTVAALIHQLQLDPEQMAVELDGRVLSRAEVAAAELAPGARLELIRFVGGG